MSLQDRIRKPLPSTKPRKPLWRGPEEDGVTFSMLSRFLVCRERFRLLVVEGLKPAPRFNHRIEYGQMWHVCEEELARHPPVTSPIASWTPWQDKLRTYCQALVKQYPFQQEEIQHWYNICREQFPVYVAYWSKQQDVQDRTPLLQEQVFDVPYKLPSGRTVRLRGKWDAVDLIGRGGEAGIYLQENKTKGDIEKEQLKRQVTYDLQTMLYLVALTSYQISPRQYRLGGEGIPRGEPINGIRYNVVRRPLSGGKGSIRQHKATKTKPAETTNEFYGRVRAVIEEDPGHFFFRLKIEVSPSEVKAFQHRTLDPILEQLCDWWDLIKHCQATGADPFIPTFDGDLSYGSQAIHWQHPFGVRNILDEGGSTDLDHYLATGSESGLERVTELFTELKE